MQICLFRRQNQTNKDFKISGKCSYLMLCLYNKRIFGSYERFVVHVNTVIIAATGGLLVA